MTKVEKTSIFNRTLEAVEALPAEEILEAVRESREAFERGDVKSGTVAELMKDLAEK